MAINARQRVWEWKGFDPTSDQLTTMAAESAYVQGSILVEDASETYRLTASINRAEFLLMKEVTVDGPTQWERFTGADQAEVEVGGLVPVFLLRIGAEWWTTAFKSATSTDYDISADSALEIPLSHINGLICTRYGDADAGDPGSVEFFRLKENTIALNGAIKVRCTNVS